MSIYELLKEIDEMSNNKLYPNWYEQEKIEKLDTDGEKEIFELLRNISRLSIKVTDKGVKFNPRKVIEGYRSFALEDLTYDDYEKLENINLNNVPLFLKVRIADILWTQKKNTCAAYVAIESYLEFFNQILLGKSRNKSLDMIKRAVTISKQLKNKDMQGKCYKVIFDYIISEDDIYYDFLVIHLIDIILKEKYGDNTTIIKIIDKILNRNFDNIVLVEHTFDVKLKYMRNQKDYNAIKKINIDRAIYFEQQAKNLSNNFQSIIRAEELIIKSINIYIDNAETAEAERLQKQLIKIQAKKTNLMIPIYSNINLNDCKNIVEKNMDGLSFEECIIRIAQLTIFHKREYIKKEILDEIEEDELYGVFSKSIINNSGQTIVKLLPLDRNEPEKNIELLNKHIYKRMTELQKLNGNTVLVCMLNYIRESYEFQLKDLDFFIDNNAIIPEGRENIFRSAIFMILKGQYYEGIHILAPQLENLFRNLAEECGGLTVTYDSEGLSKKKLLSSIFNLDELTDCYDEDILFVFRGLLNEQAGANIRNDIAHGILEEDVASSGVCLYFVCAVIKLLVKSSVNCFNILKESKKLQSICPITSHSIQLSPNRLN